LYELGEYGLFKTGFLSPIFDEVPDGAPDDTLVVVLDIVPAGPVKASIPSIER
jgi:hypothetical protein